MQKLGLVFAAVSATALGMPHAAFAQDKAAADAAFREARTLVEAGRYDEACPKFQLSNELDPAIGTLLNLADCHEKQGRTASAWAEFNEVAERGRHAGQRARADEGARRATALEKRLMRLKLVQSSAGAGDTIHLGDSDVTKLSGVPFPVDPGSHKVSVRRRGETLWERDVDVQGEGKVTTVEIPPASELDAVAAAREKAKEADTGKGEGKGKGEDKGGERDVLTSPTPMPHHRSGLGAQRYFAIAAASVGLLSLGGSAYFAVSARKKYDDSRPLCNDDNICTQEGADLVGAAQSRARNATIFAGVGVLGLVGGAVLWFTAPDRNVEPRESEGVTVRPSLAPGEIGVALEGAF